MPKGAPESGDYPVALPGAFLALPAVLLSAGLAKGKVTDGTGTLRGRVSASLDKANKANKAISIKTLLQRFLRFRADNTIVI